MTLHEAIEKILQETGQPMTTREIADMVNKRGLYTRKDGNPVTATQISARVRNYEYLFSRDLDRIKLVEDDLVSLKIQEIKSELTKLANIDLEEDKEAETLIDVLKEKELFEDTSWINEQDPQYSFQSRPIVDSAFPDVPSPETSEEVPPNYSPSFDLSPTNHSDTKESTAIEPRYRRSYKSAYSKREKKSFWDIIRSFFKRNKTKESANNKSDESAIEESTYEKDDSDNILSEGIDTDAAYSNDLVQEAISYHKFKLDNPIFDKEFPEIPSLEESPSPTAYFENLKITYTIFRWFLIQRYRGIPLLSEELASFIAGLYWFQNGVHVIHSDFEHTIHDLIKVVYENPNAKFKVHNQQVKQGDIYESQFARTSNRFIESMINEASANIADDKSSFKTGVFVFPFTTNTNKDDSVNELIKTLNFENPAYDKAIIIVADKFLSSRQVEDLLFKKKILEEKCLEAVVHFSKDLIVNAVFDMSLIVLDFNKQKEEVFLYNALSQKALLSTTIFNEKTEEPNVSKRTPVNELLNEPYNLAPERYIIDPSLTQLEPGYDLVKIENLILDKKSGRFILKRKLYPDGEYKLIRNMDIDKNSLYFRSNPSYPLLGADHDEIADVKSLLVQGGVVLTGFKEELKANILSEGEKYILGSEVYWLQLNEDRILPEYFVREITKEYVVNQVKQHTSWIGENSITFQDVLEIQIKVPTIEKQSKLVAADTSKDLDTLLKTKQEASEVDFIYTLEHSLKQPASGLGNDLASLRSFIENKVKSKDPLSMEESIVPLFATDTAEQIAIHTLANTLSRMQRAVTDIDYILRQARLLATAKTKSDLEAIELKSFLQNMANDNRDIMFYIEGSNASIKADRKQLRILFSNFIDNARRHGFKESKDSPSIWIEIMASAPYETKIAIRNNGKSLPPEFSIEDFLAKGKSSMQDVGSGFGGFLIGQIVRNHKGNLTLTDKSELELVPYNVEFVLTLPKEV